MIGRLEHPLEVAADQPWTKDFRFWKGRSKTVPFAVVQGDAILKRQGTTERLELTIGAGVIIINGNAVGVRLPSDTLEPGTYDLEVRATSDTGSGHQIRAVVVAVAGL